MKRVKGWWVPELSRKLGLQCKQYSVRLVSTITISKHILFMATLSRRLKFLRPINLHTSSDLAIPVLGWLRSITDTLSNYAPLPGVSAALGTAQEVAILIQVL
jgi:hypothetical protein